MTQRRYDQFCIEIDTPRQSDNFASQNICSFDRSFSAMFLCHPYGILLLHALRLPVLRP